MASRMQPAIYETTSVKISGGEYLFTVAASKIKFDGFMSVYVQEDEEKAQNNTLVRSIDKDTVLNFQKFDEQQHFTQPPAHYTEASLGKNLWKNWESVVQVLMHRLSPQLLQEDMWQKRIRTCI